MLSLLYFILSAPVPDLHQPLHSAALFTVEVFPHGDKGGNAIQIKRRGASGGAKNVHSVWDGFLGQSSRFNHIQGKAHDLIGAHQAEFNAPVVAMPYDVWSTEVVQIAASQAYEPLADQLSDAEQQGEARRWPLAYRDGRTTESAATKFAELVSCTPMAGRVVLIRQHSGIRYRPGRIVRICRQPCIDGISVVGWEAAYQTCDLLILCESAPTAFGRH